MACPAVWLKTVINSPCLSFLYIFQSFKEIVKLHIDKEEGNVSRIAHETLGRDQLNTLDRRFEEIDKRLGSRM